MKRIFLITLLALTTPLSLHAETIRSFMSDIELSPDGTFTVSETIEYDFEGEERHGIYRTIPTGHPEASGAWYLDRYLEIDLLEVSMDGAAVPYEETQEMREFEVKIGDPDRTITGAHTYMITYRVRGGLVYNDGEATELYFNATGNDWEVPIQFAEARVTARASMLVDASACYVGARGSTERCSVATTTDGVVFTAEDLAPGEELTIAQELAAGEVAELILVRPNLLPFWLVGGLLWLVGLAVFAYRHHMTHRSGRAIVAQYEPYEGFKPMYTGLLFDGRLDARDITAGIVYLAEQGFFKIERTEKKVLIWFNADDYVITLKRPYAELETDFQKEVFTLLFAPEAEPGTSVSLGELGKDMAKQKDNHKTLTRLKSAAHADLVEQGFFEHTLSPLVKICLAAGAVLVLLVAVALLMNAGAVISIVFAVFIMIGTIVIAAFMYRRRTAKGYLALDHLKGFKEFLSVTDKERFAFHNAPEKSPEQFMEFLPYAIAFGVEKEWAKVFEDIAIPQPDWYDGHGAAFSAVHLTNSVGAFSTALASSSVASSGGGSAGGGAGGGGGGSW